MQNFWNDIEEFSRIEDLFNSSYSYQFFMDPTEGLQTDLIPLDYPVVNGRQGKYPQPIELPPHSYASDNTPLLIVNTTTFPYRTEKESPWHPGVVCDVTLGARAFQISFSNRQTAFLTGPSENGAPREDDESMPRVISTTRGAILFLPERENNLANHGIEDTARQQWGILVDYSKRGGSMVIINEWDTNLEDDERCWDYNRFTDQMLSFVSPQSFS